MQSGFRYEFYNAGNRINEMLRFSISSSSAGFNADGNDIQSVGFWSLDAPKESFFEVPAEVKSGHEVLRVNFADDVKRRFGKMGVVIVDPAWDPATEDPDKELSEYPIAPTGEAAVVRGEVIWKLHLRKIVEQHLSDCQNAMAAGGAPRAASGFTKKAFTLLGIADPGETYFKGLREAGKSAATTENNAVLLEIQRSNSAMLAIVVALASGKQVDPELLKALLPPSGTAPAMPVMSGVATGEVKKPVGEFDPKRAGLDGVPVEKDTHGQVGLEAYNRKTAPKTSRSAKAAKELAGD